MSPPYRDDEMRFELFCPAIQNSTILGPFTMFNNGSFQRNTVNFHDICPVTQNRKSIRIAFDQGVLIAVNNQTNEMVETGERWDMSVSLVESGGRSVIPREWEIIKLFLWVNNIVPTWVDCKGVGTLYYKENKTWSGLVGKVDYYKVNHIKC